MNDNNNTPKAFEMGTPQVFKVSKVALNVDASVVKII